MISIFGKEYTSKTLADIDYKSVADADEQEALRFLHDWINGEQAFEQQTSGSTGEPKRILITREQMLASAKLTGDFLQLKKLNSCLLPISAKYIGGKMLLVRALLYQMHLEVIKPAANFFENLTPQHRFSLTSIVPSQLEVIRHNVQAKENLQNFDTVLIGGAALPQTIEMSLRDLTRVNLWATYGMTETISHIALRKVNGAGASDFFQPLPGVQIQKDARGCLSICAAVTQNSWITTNDLVEIHEGHFRILGRFDEIINSGGVKIEPKQVEEVVLEVMATLQQECLFFVGALPHETLGEQVVLVIESSPWEFKQQENIILALKERLPRYHVPGRVFFLDRFLLTGSGKVHKIKILESLLKE